jgi:glutamate synthase domain-containing protein 2
MGGFKCSLPVSIGAMGSTKVASTIADTVSKGAAEAGIVRIIGENIMATFGKEGLKCMIDPFLNHYEELGAIIVQASYTDMKLKALETGVELGAQAIELKFGQGAKQGLGGEITFEGKIYAKKYDDLGYLILEHDEKTFERHTHPGSLIRQSFMEQLKKYSELNVPIWIKIGIGNGIYEFLKLCQEAKKKENIKIKCVTIDGHGGGTGMSPWAIMNETSLPSIAALEKANKMKLDFDLLVAGGFTDGVDVAKAIMLGANGVAMARPFLIAANTDKTKGILNFVKALKEELRMVCTTQRVYDVKELRKNRKNLIALCGSASKMFGLAQKL